MKPNYIYKRNIEDRPTTNRVSIGTKSYKVIFAKSNLTATGLATKESDFGDYFAWGVAEPNYESYTRTGSGSSVTVVVNAWKDDKPNGYEYYPALSKEYAEYEDFVMADDPASKILGGDWQVPTRTIWEALRTAINAKISSSNGSEVIIDGIKGRKFTKTNDSNTYIFLPHAGTLQKKFTIMAIIFPIGRVLKYIVLILAEDLRLRIRVLH